jgi:hypothetical protein
MNISSGMREGLAIGIGAVLGSAAIGGGIVALTSGDDQTRKVAGIVAATGLATATGLGALLLRSPATRPDVMLGAMGFIGLPSLLATGMIQNRRDT